MPVEDLGIWSGTVGTGAEKQGSKEKKTRVWRKERERNYK